MEKQEQRPKKKKGVKIALIVILIFFGIMIAGAISVMVNGEPGAGSIPPVGPTSQSESDIDFNSSAWITNAKEMARDYLRQYCKTDYLDFALLDERAWFVEFEYNYGEDDSYTGTKNVYGYYVSEGGFDYDIPGDGKDKVPIDYSVTVFVTDNADGYRWDWRTIVLTYDGVEIENLKNPDYFSE